MNFASDSRVIKGFGMGTSSSPPKVGYGSEGLAT